jgi:hypothetical protein
MNDPLRDLHNIAALLPAEKQHEVLDFAQFVLARCQRELTNGSSENEDLAREQRKAIQAMAGRSMGPGFDGREHDRVLYEDR